MRLRTSWLSQREKDHIVREAMAVLEGVGMRVSGTTRLDEIAAAGACVDAATGVVRLPKKLVGDALERAPRRFLMAGADEAHDRWVEEDAPTMFSSSGCTAFTLDHRTGERRPSTLCDLREMTIVLDELDEVDVIWTTAAASDLPPEGRDLVEYGTVLLNSAKHVTFVNAPSDARSLARLAEATSGTIDAFAERPRFSTLFTVASPLVVDGHLLDVHAASAAGGAPVEIYSLTMTGGTAPITLAGTITQTLAELFGALCLLMILAPGAKVILGPAPAVLDMRSSQLSYAAPESVQMAAACVEVVHALGVPVIAPGMATDAKHPGLQAGLEKGMKALTLCAAGADLLSGGVGTIDAASLLSLPQAVIDAEIAAMIRVILSEVSLDDDAVQAEAIARVGIGGSFLGEKETRRRMRDLWRPRILSHEPYEAWLYLGGGAGAGALARASARVEEILARRAWSAAPVDAQVCARVAATCGIDVGQAASP